MTQYVPDVVSLKGLSRLCIIAVTIGAEPDRAPKIAGHENTEAGAFAATVP